MKQAEFKTYTYKAIRVQLDNMANVQVIGKRQYTYWTTAELNIGGLYFLKPGKLYRILSKVD